MVCRRPKRLTHGFVFFFPKRAHVSTITPNRLATDSFLPKLRRNEGKKEGRISCHANTNGPGLLEAKVGSHETGLWKMMALDSFEDGGSKGFESMMCTSHMGKTTQFIAIDIPFFNAKIISKAPSSFSPKTKKTREKTDLLFQRKKKPYSFYSECEDEAHYSVHMPTIYFRNGHRRSSYPPEHHHLDRRFF